MINSPATIVDEALVHACNIYLASVFFFSLSELRFCFANNYLLFITGCKSALVYSTIIILLCMHGWPGRWPDEVRQAWCSSHLAFD